MSLSSPPQPRQQAQGHRTHTLGQERREYPPASAWALALWAALNLAANQSQADHPRKPEGKGPSLLPALPHILFQGQRGPPSGQQAHL